MFIYPQGMSPEDQREYARTLGWGAGFSNLPADDEEPLCEARCAITDATCSLARGHADSHRDSSDWRVSVSWLDVPKVVVLNEASD